MYTEIFDYVANSASKLWQVQKIAFALVNQKVQMKVQMHFFAFALSFAFFQRQVQMQFFAFAIILIENLQHIRFFLRFWNIFEMVVMGFWDKKTEKERFRREFGCKLFWKRLTWPFFSVHFNNKKNGQTERKVKGYLFTILVIFQVFSQTCIKINLESVGKTSQKLAHFECFSWKLWKC